MLVCIHSVISSPAVVSVRCNGEHRFWWSLVLEGFGLWPASLAVTQSPQVLLQRRIAKSFLSCIIDSPLTLHLSHLSSTSRSLPFLSLASSLSCVQLNKGPFLCREAHSFSAVTLRLIHNCLLWVNRKHSSGVLVFSACGAPSFLLFACTDT